MALNDPFDAVDSANIDTAYPVIQYGASDFDGFRLRNEHDNQLGKRDQYLLDLIKAVKAHSTANVSPLYPFDFAATLKPSMAIPYDANGDLISDFVIDDTALTLSTSFIADLKFIIANEFSQPYLSKMVLRKAVDPNTSLVQIFIDLYISARYTGDQDDHVILKLVSKAYNDVQDNSAPSSRDDVPLDFVAEQVDSRDWLNTGVVRFRFLGSVQSSLSTSWSVGVYGNATVEGFAGVPGLTTIEFTFSRGATAITEMAYSRLGDLQSAVPFLAKIAQYPFSIDATAGKILAKYITDINITGPASERVYLKRIRRAPVNSVDTFVFLFAYNLHDLLGNYVGTVNVGKATVTSTSGNRVEITTLGSNTVAGAAPDWLDEVVDETVDNMGRGSMTVTSYAAMSALFAELISAPIEVGSPSPIEVSPVAPVTIVGLDASLDLIEMIEENAWADSLCVDVQGVLVSIQTHALPPTSISKNVRVNVGGTLVNRRTAYGPESLMRTFFGIVGTESLVDNDKIPLEDQWFDDTTNTLKQYQYVQGHRRWRNV